MAEILSSKKGPRTELRRVGVLAWLRMMRIVHRNDQAAAEHLRRWDLTHAQFDVLAHLGAANGLLTQTDLASRLFVTQGNITQLLDRLERRGLVQRCPEGRSNYLSLTAEGKRVYEEVVPAQEDWQAERLCGLDEAEQQELLRLLSKLDRTLR